MRIAQRDHISKPMNENKKGKILAYIELVGANEKIQD